MNERLNVVVLRQTRTSVSDEKKWGEKSVWINQVHAQHTPINPLRIPFMLFYTLFFSHPPSSQQLNENVYNQVSSLLRIWWRMIVVGALKRRKSFSIRKRSLTLHVILCYYYAHTFMCVDDGFRHIFELAFFYGLLIVNDDVNVHQNDWIMLWCWSLCVTYRQNDRGYFLGFGH